MQFLTIVLTTLSIAASTMAAPAPVAEPAAAAPQAQPLIDLWQDKDFLGIKFTGSAKLEECKNFQGQNDNVFESGKSKPNFRCTIWVDKDCKGTGFSFNTKPGAPSFPGWINKKASSWKCVAA